jgi:cytochrome o ubiquinol oxidase subunit 2
MNAFYVPALAGMVYAMPGMETKLHAVINQPGRYEGCRPTTAAPASRHALPVPRPVGRRLRALGGRATAPASADRAAYLKLEQPSEREPVRRYGQVEPACTAPSLNRCVDAPRCACTR